MSSDCQKLVCCNPPIWGADLIQCPVNNPFITVGSVSLCPGFSEQLTVTLTASDGTTSDVTSLSTFASSDETIVAVNDAGVVFGVAEGVVTITATYIGGLTATAGVAVLGQSICNPFTLSGFPENICGCVDDDVIFTFRASGGVAPYTYVIVSGSLPGTLALDPDTGVLSGTITEAGNFTFTVRATDSTAAFVEGTFEFGTIGLTPTTLPDGTVDEFYSATLVGNGGEGSFTYAITAGSLPTGLTLNTSTGEISGTPEVGATNHFTVTVTDAECPTIFTNTEQVCTRECPPGYSGDPVTVTIPAGSYFSTISVADANAQALAAACAQASAQLICTPALPPASIFLPDIFRLQAAGRIFYYPDPIDLGDYTYQLQRFVGDPDNPTWTLISGSLPPGLTMSPSGFISGIVSEQVPWIFPLDPQPYNFWVTAAVPGQATLTLGCRIHLLFGVQMVNGGAIFPPTSSEFHPPRGPEETYFRTRVDSPTVDITFRPNVGPAIGTPTFNAGIFLTSTEGVEQWEMWVLSFYEDSSEDLCGRAPYLVWHATRPWAESVYGVWNLSYAGTTDTLGIPNFGIIVPDCPPGGGDATIEIV